MLTKFSLNNKTTVNFLIFIILVGGIASYFKLGKLEDPDFTIKSALIFTPYPGASPYEVEQQVTRKIEEAVQTAQEVEKIRSESRVGFSLIYVDLYESVGSKEIEQLWDILRRKVGDVQGSLPAGAMPSQIFDDYGDVFGIFLALTGDGLEHREIKKYAKYIKRELLLVKDVEKVILFGEQEETVNIEINHSKAAALGVHPGVIINSIKSQNQITIPGKMETDSKRIRIAQKGVFHSIDEIGNLIIQGNGSKQIRLRDIAAIKSEYNDPPKTMMRFNGMDSIGIGISAKTGANVVKMGEAVQKRLDELLAELPAGTKIDGIYYQSDFVKNAISKFMVNLMQSVAIVVFILLITMGLRPGLIIASNLVLSISATFIVMIIWGIDLQRISLAALIIVMGMIVDNAIVVTEASQSMLEKKAKRLDAVLLPPKQTGIPLLGATIIAVLAFLPIYLSPTNVGEYVSSLSIVVGISLLLSWLFALTQTPLFNFYFLKESSKKKDGDDQESFFYSSYKNLLNLALNNRTATVAIMVLMLCTGIFYFNKLQINFFAVSEKTQFFVDYRRPEGTKIESVAKDIEAFEKYLKSRDEVVNFTSCVGHGAPRFAATLTPESINPAFAQVVVNVKNYKEIDRLKQEFESWFFENLPQGTPHIWKYIAGPSADYNVEVRISGRDPKVLKDISHKIENIMKENAYAESVTNDWKERVMVYDLDYSQIRAKKAGIEREHLAFSALAATSGIPVSNFKKADELIPVKLKYENADPRKFEGLPVWGNRVESVPLLQTINKNSVYFEDPVVRRYNRRRVIRAQCEPVFGVTSDFLVRQIKPEVEKLKLPKGYIIEWEGEKELSDIANAGVQKNLPVCLLSMLIILVVLFNSVKQPLIITFTLPFAIIGITAGLLLMNQPFGFLPIIGAYSLIGMLIKNAVVLIDEINLNLANGQEKFHAIENACMSRMRPVLLASLTTILGMIPLLKDDFFISMAITIMFGLFVATFLTLFLIPVLYSAVYNIKPVKH